MCIMFNAQFHTVTTELKSNQVCSSLPSHPMLRPLRLSQAGFSVRPCAEVRGFWGVSPPIWALQAIKKGAWQPLRCTVSYRACAGCMREREVQLPSGAIACHVRRANFRGLYANRAWPRLIMLTRAFIAR